jgi:hypothetical protein
MNEVSNPSSTWKNAVVPRGNCHNKTESKTTVSICSDRNLVERAKNHRLNLSKITEQAPCFILDYLGTQDIKPSSESLNERSLPEKAQWARSSVRLERRTLNP